MLWVSSLVEIQSHLDGSLTEKKAKTFRVLRDGPLEKWWRGVGDFSPARIIFLAHFLCKNFFLATALCMNFFFLRKYFPYAQFAIELIKNNATLLY